METYESEAKTCFLWSFRLKFYMTQRRLYTNHRAVLNKCSILRVRKNPRSGGIPIVGSVDHLVEEAVPVFEKGTRFVELGDLSLVQDHDPVVVEDGVQAMRNGEHGTILELISDCCLNW